MSKKRRYEVVTLGDLVKQVTRWLVDIILVIALALTLTHLFGTRVRMEGSSMTPTLSNEDKLMLNRLKGKILTIRRYDIVAYELDSQEGIFLKRVLALPGETLQIKEGKVFINGEVLPDNDYIRSLSYAGEAQKLLTMGEEEYFVIGENADASLDSRFSDVGSIKADHIWGTVWFRYGPFQNLRLIP